MTRWLLLSLAGTTALHGEPRFSVAGVFGDHAVLQRGVAVPVWGAAAPGAGVRVAFRETAASTVADGDGRWLVRLDALAASSDGAELSVHCGDQSVVLEDIVVGEVWLASGQSNMQHTLRSSASKLDAIRGVMGDPVPLGIRMLRIGAPDAPEPLRDLDRRKWRWEVDSAGVRGDQSAVAFFFARRLHRELGVPVGIIESSWGGKPIEGFIPREEFEGNETLKPIAELADASELDKLEGIEGGVIVRNTAGLPGRIFNSRIAPTAPYALRGAFWYQAESNAGAGEDPRNYRHKMRALIEGWRRVWKDDTMPFYFVQLPPYRDSAYGWVRAREEQRLSLAIPHTGMAVTIDLRDPDIHPPNKLDVGERLALWALARDYGREGLVPSGPLFRGAEFVDGAATVQFDHAEGGLMVARKEGLHAPRETPGAAIEGLQLAGADGIWHDAHGEIAGTKLSVRAAAVPEPVAVRYACRGAPPNANLYNRAGLPASPFCSKLEFLPWPAGGSGD